MQELISTRRAAEIAGIHPLTVRRRINEGVLTPYRLRTNKRNLYIDRAELEQLMQPRKVNNAARVAA